MVLVETAQGRTIDFADTTGFASQRDSPLYTWNMIEGQFESANTETAILSRLIDAERSGLAPEAARYILTLEFKDTDKERMNELAEKVREGTLSSGEERELENYRHVGHLLALLRSKARISLNQRDTV